MRDGLDPRLNAYRADRADGRLLDRVDATTYVDGVPARVAVPFADLRRAPEEGAGLDCQVLNGHDVLVFDEENGWSWVQNQTDGYVGYVRSETLASRGADPTHMITAPRSFRYPEPDLKSPRAGCRSMGSRIRAVGEREVRGTRYVELDDATFMIARHVATLADLPDDPVTVAETLLHAPYLWGGNTGFGLDCSGLVQLANMVCGRSVPRDTYMQVEFGTERPLDFDALERGDLVFWTGHVGIMRDATTLLHANGNTMDVALEPLDKAIARIGYLYGQPTGVRRF